MNSKSTETIPTLALLFTLVAAACESPPSSPTVTVFDSAGVRVVDLGPVPLESAENRALADEPDLVIRSSEDDGATVFSDIRDVEVLPRGCVAVANGSGNDILVFDAAGEHIATWGGTGDAPGEFRSLEWLASLPPDSLAAGDGRLRRVTIFDSEGGFARGLATASAVDRASRPVPPRPLGLLANGSVVAGYFDRPAAVEGTARPAVEIVATAPAGDSMQMVGTWPGEELALFSQDGQLQITQPPFGRRLHVASAHDGVWIADDDRWQMRKYSAGGVLSMIVRSSASRAVVTDELLEAYIGERYRYADQVPALEDLKRDQREIARHTTTPAFGAIRPTTEGGVAVSEFKLDTVSPRVWITVGPDGAVQAIELPAGLDVKRWGPDWVIGVVRDALDREEIHRYRIVAGAGREY
ncbi:MAG: hypothetical protein F4139_14680 [Gemmatimonadetes bacterium]|nr:hypothetical protein [Gemmatimonadota bacterium]MYH54164.1 hypothetical protein [Gemmatimonadota bacterium]MYK67019.1 hypothetical protein [Gemmatimonadota bacterium]